MSKLADSWPPTTSATVWLIESQTPAAPSTDQTISTDTTVTMPHAIDSRNAVFITDQGAIRVNLSRARRGARPRTAAFLAATLDSGRALARCSSAAVLIRDEM